MFYYIMPHLFVIIGIAISLFSLYQTWVPNKRTRLKEKKESEPRFYCEFNDSLDILSFENIGPDCFNFYYETEHKKIKEVSFSKRIKKYELIKLMPIFDTNDPIMSTEYLFQSNSHITISLFFSDSINNKYKQTFNFIFDKSTKSILKDVNPSVFRLNY